MTSAPKTYGWPAHVSCACSSIVMLYGMHAIDFSYGNLSKNWFALLLITASLLSFALNVVLAIMDIRQQPETDIQQVEESNKLSPPSKAWRVSGHIFLAVAAGVVLHLLLSIEFYSQHTQWFYIFLVGANVLGILFNVAMAIVALINTEKET